MIYGAGARPELPKGVTCILAERDEDQVVVSVVETWDGGKEVSIPVDDEDAAEDLLRQLWINTSDALVRVFRE